MDTLVACMAAISDEPPVPARITKTTKAEAEILDCYNISATLHGLRTPTGTRSEPISQAPGARSLPKITVHSLNAFPPPSSLPSYTTTMPEGNFQDAHDFSITSPQFNDNPQIFNTLNFNSQTVSGHQTIQNSQVIGSQTINNGGGSGLHILLNASTPEASHDSSARYPPPRCHPGTRQDYIRRITNWGRGGDSNRRSRILWVKGPAGVGKSAVAQSCAEAMGDRLGAAFFFSQPNARHDPNRFFTSISYQLAVKFESYGDSLDHRIRRNPTLVKKSPIYQFQDLIATPLKDLKSQGKDVGELVIIVDGLDECAGKKAQCDIIEIVAASVRDRTTPLLWIFFSRPEPHIVATFTSQEVFPLSFHIELPVSRTIDFEIARYLIDELGKVGREHGLLAPWPSERDIWTLVDRSAGLFVYAATVVRFIGKSDTSGPDDDLRSVLHLPTPRSTDDYSRHPLSELDLFYTLIMKRISPTTLLVTQKILLATTFISIKTNAVRNANLLGLSELQFRNALRSLHSVLELDDQNIRFYHASFMEFLQDETRSKNLCVNSDCAIALRRELLQRLDNAHTSTNLTGISVTWPADPADISEEVIYRDTVFGFFNLCQSTHLDNQSLAALRKLSYEKILTLSKCTVAVSPQTLSAETLRQNIPRGIRGKIIRPYRRLVLFHYGLFEKPYGADGSQPYILGRGKNKVLCWRDQEDGGSIISAYPHLHQLSISRVIVNKITCH